MAAKEPRQHIQEAFAKFCDTIAALRHPTKGCPWDLQQDHQSLRRYMLEEAYEAVAVMQDDDHKALCEELGDVLLQVVLNAQVAADAKKFSIVDVIKGIDAKMQRRHPHVFTSATGGETAQQVRDQWEVIKAAEKPPSASMGVFAKVAAGGDFPAGLQALNIGKAAKKIQFDWANAGEVFKKLASEVRELAKELELSAGAPSPDVRAELGDLYFSLAQLCRHLDYDPETVALDGNRKFLDRFKILEALARQQNIDVGTAGPQVLERLWNEAKKASV